MSHSPKKKIWAGALAALLALFAAVVVATPAVADPAGEMDVTSKQGYGIYQTSNKDADVSDLIEESSTAVTVKPSSSITDITVQITGTPTLPLVIAPQSGATGSVITLNGITASVPSNATATPLTLGSDGGENTFTINLVGSNSFTSSNNGTVFSVANNASSVSVSLTGSGTLSATTDVAATPAMAMGTSTLNVGANSAVTDPTSETGATYPNTPSLTVSNTNGPCITATSLTMTVAKGCSLNASTTGQASDNVNLGEGPLTLNGSATITTGNASGVETVGLTAGTVTVGSATSAGTLTVTSAGTAIKGNPTLANGSVTATSSAGIGIDGNVTVTGGELTATGGVTPSYLDGVENTPQSGISGTLTVSNTLANSDGPTVNVQAGDISTLAATPAVAGDSITVKSVPSTSEIQNYQWVAYAGGGMDKPAPDPDEEPGPDAVPPAALETRIYGFAGMDGDEKGTGATVTPQGNSLTIEPAKVTSWELGITPASNSYGSADHLNMPDGYMVANIGSVSSASDGYVYDVTIIPGAFSNNISYPLAKGVNAGTVADPSSSIATQPAGAVANKQTLSTLRNGVWVTGNLTGAEPSVSLATKASTTVADLSSSAVVDALYDKATVGATNIPVSYQVVFNSQTSNPVSQPAPDPTNKDAVVLDFGNKGGSQGIYFTEPGTGNMVYNVPDPSSESVESVEVTDLPIVADNNSYVLGWYTHSFNKDGQDIYGPEPLTEVAPVTQNTINYALYGKFELVNKNLVLGNSPISIMAGESGSYTATLKININPSPAGVQTQEPAIVIDPSVVQIQNHGKSIISDDSINYGTGTDNGEMNGVQLGEPSLTAGEAEGTYTLDIPVMTGGNASQGAYQVNVKLNLNGLSATDGTTLQGVLNIDGVAADADIAVIRYYNPYDGEHVLTTVQNESLALLTAGWLPEDIAWFAPADGQAVYRLYNPYNHDHYYTTDEAEVNSLVTLGWEKDFVNADGTQTPVFYGDTESSLYPVFQLFNPYVTSGTHLWTTNTVEVASLINPSVGWKNEGPKWFASYPGTNL